MKKEADLEGKNASVSISLRSLPWLCRSARDVRKFEEPIQTSEGYYEVALPPNLSNENFVEMYNGVAIC